MLSLVLLLFLNGVCHFSSKVENFLLNFLRPLWPNLALKSQCCCCCAIIQNQSIFLSLSPHYFPFTRAIQKLDYFTYKKISGAVSLFFTIMITIISSRTHCLALLGEGRSWV